MDDTDRKLINLLRRNGRMPVASLAQVLGLSRATVQNRIDRLLRDGIIAGFTVRVRADDEQAPIRAVTLIEVEGERTEPVIRALRSMPEIVALHTTNGRWDLVAELATDTLEAFDKALLRIRETKGVAGSETSLLLSSHKWS